jgi:hypothetical protein
LKFRKLEIDWANGELDVKINVKDHSVVIPCLKEIYPAFTDQIHDTVLLGQPPGPSPSGEMLEWFRFANTTKWVTQNRFDQRQRTESGPPIGLDPIAQVLAKLWMKDRLTLDRARCAPPT